MMLARGKEALEEAYRGGYAVGAFSVSTWKARGPSAVRPKKRGGS